MGIPISNVTRRVVFAPSGTGPYAFTFEILAVTDIEVYKGDNLLTLTTDYTVTINPNGTGEVNLVATAGTDNITIIGARAIERSTDFVTGGDFFANTVNEEFDSLTIFAQQNAEGIERALRAPETDPTTINMTLPRAADRADKFLAFDSSGNPVPGAVPDEITEVLAIEPQIIAVAAIDDQIVIVSGITASVVSVAGISTQVSTVAGISGNVTAVAGNATNINAVATDLLGADNIGTVAGIATEVTQVAAVSGDLATIIAIDDQITVVGGIATDVTTVANISGDVTIVAGIAGDIPAAAAIDAGDLAAVAAISTDVTRVAAIDTNVTKVADIDGQVTVVGGIATDVSTVASIAGNVTTVAGIDTEIIAVAGDATDIGIVAGLSTEIQTLGPIASDITTVAGIDTAISAIVDDVVNIDTVANNITDVNTVAGIAGQVTVVSGIATDITTVATNVTDITNFSDVYLGPKSSDPATRNDSSALQAGDLYFNTDDDVIKVYTGSIWTVAYVPEDGFLVAANNLSDLTNASTARANLDLEPGVDVLAYDSNLQSFVTAFTLPTTDGSSNQLLKTNGSGVISFASITGTGDVVLSTSPTLVTPVLGTPTSGQLSNCTVDGADAVGFRTTPINSQSAAYTLVLADSGKTILHPDSDDNARTFTIPANSSVAYPVGTVVTFVNMKNTLTIAITTDTMYLAGPGTTGSRTLAEYGVATAVKLTSTTWLISGNGIS
jgi:hypothetical protein